MSGKQQKSLVEAFKVMINPSIFWKKRPHSYEICANIALNCICILIYILIELSSQYGRQILECWHFKFAFIMTISLSINCRATYGKNVSNYFLSALRKMLLSLIWLHIRQLPMLQVLKIFPHLILKLMKIYIMFKWKLYYYRILFQRQISIL